MTEVPEHLLERSRARRVALGLDGGEAPAAAAPAADASSASPATTEAAAPAAATAAPAAPVVKEVPPPPAHVQYAIDRKKIPWWAASVLAFVPLWAIVYAGTLSEADTGGATVLEHGGEIYAASCAGCHGGTGGGGAGPALAGGAVLATFPERADHLFWVHVGSAGWPASTYGATNKSVGSGMPSFDSLSPEDLLAVVRYEREVLSGEEILEENGELLGPDDELIMVQEDGTEVDAVTYYFGEGAEGGTFAGAEGAPFVNGAEHSGPAE